MAKHERFEAAIDTLEGQLTDSGGWGVPTDLEEDGWTLEEYRADLEDALKALETVKNWPEIELIDEIVKEIE
jgi:hypothetical protein